MCSFDGDPTVKIVQVKWLDFYLPLQTWMKLQTLSAKKGIYHNYESFKTLMSHQCIQHMEIKQKYCSKWHKLWWWTSLMFKLVETLYGSVMIKQSFKRLESIPTWFDWENTAIIMYLLIDLIVIHVTEYMIFHNLK